MEWKWAWKCLWGGASRLCLSRPKFTDSHQSFTRSRWSRAAPAGLAVVKVSSCQSNDNTLFLDGCDQQLLPSSAHQGFFFFISDSVFEHFKLNCVFSFQKETTLCLCRVRYPSLLSDIYLIFTQQSSLISQFTSLISQGELFFFFLLWNLFLTQSLHFKLQQFLCKRSQNSWILMWFQFHPLLFSTRVKEAGNKAVEKPWAKSLK